MLILIKHIFDIFSPEIFDIAKTIDVYLRCIVKHRCVFAMHCIEIKNIDTYFLIDICSLNTVARPKTFLEPWVSTC